MHENDKIFNILITIDAVFHMGVIAGNKEGNDEHNERYNL